MSAVTGCVKPAFLFQNKSWLPSDKDIRSHKVNNKIVFRI